jgi:four helix bundle protein
MKGGLKRMGNFQELKVWNKAKDLAVFVYKITEQGLISKDYGLRDQMRRSAVSVPSNIAEGDELDSDRQSVKYFYIAKGSSAELLTQSVIAHEIMYLNDQHFDHILKGSRAISSMLTRLIGARSRKKA